MGSIELEQFSLVVGTSREEFLRLDAEAQAWAYRHRDGLRRRTTAVDADGGVLVVTLLGTDAEAREAPGPSGPLAAVVDPATYRRSRYVDLG
jgi:hypothetical protein